MNSPYAVVPPGKTRINARCAATHRRSAPHWLPKAARPAVKTKVVLVCPTGRRAWIDLLATYRAVQSCRVGWLATPAAPPRPARPTALPTTLKPLHGQIPIDRQITAGGECGPLTVATPAGSVSATGKVGNLALATFATARLRAPTATYSRAKWGRVTGSETHTHTGGCTHPAHLYGGCRTRHGPTASGLRCRCRVAWPKHLAQSPSLVAA